MIMNGLMESYEKYIESLDRMQEPVVPKAKIDMRGAMEYAKKKGVLVGSLTKEEKELFIRYI